LDVARQASAEAGIGVVLLNPQQSENTAGTFADLDSIFSAGPGGFRAVEVAHDAVAAILYTSGTTADPKGVMLTHANLDAEIKGILHWANIGPGDAILGILPMFHVLAQMANLLLPIASG